VTVSVIIDEAGQKIYDDAGLDKWHHSMRPSLFLVWPAVILPYSSHCL